MVLVEAFILAFLGMVASWRLSKMLEAIAKAIKERIWQKIFKKV